MISESARFYRIRPNGMIGVCTLTGGICDTFESQNHDCRRCNTPLYIGMTDEGRLRIKKSISKALEEEE